MARDIVESCDAPGCSSVRNWKQRGSKAAAPQDGWFGLSLHGDDHHVHLSACSVGCAAKLVQTTLEGLKGDLAIEFCPGHADGKPH